MKISSLLLVAILLSVWGLPLIADTADSLRREAEEAKRASDSLYTVWDQMWKRSDSLRIESMLVRIKSNILKREARSKLKAAESAPPTRTVGDIIEDGEIVELLALQSTYKVKAELVRGGKVRRGQTISDSATALVMTAEPDTGMASYYGKKFHGRKTSSGATFNMYERTCAHRWLPYGTQLRVVNLSNQREVIVTVNDRGPFKHGRLMDLSRQAAEDLGMINSGTTRVAIEVVP